MDDLKAEVVTRVKEMQPHMIAVRERVKQLRADAAEDRIIPRNYNMDHSHWQHTQE
jgi:hypothetical protein